jgi:hypothetical protein
MKVGAFFPTHQNPLLMRLQLLQLSNQSRRPDLVAVHQNGEGESYSKFYWDFMKYFPDINTYYYWTESKIPAPTCEWYRPALKWLVEQQCDVYFLLDHDNIVTSDHISNQLPYYPEFDIVANKSSDMLFLWQEKIKCMDGGYSWTRMPYRWERDVDYKKLSGFDYMESSVSFSHKVALDLLERTKDSKENYGRVFQRLTKDYKMKILDSKTVCFVSHPESTTYARP